MILPKLLGAAALAAALLPATAQAAPPWSDPVAVPGTTGQISGTPDVLFTRTRGGAVAFNGPGSLPGAPLLRSSLGDSGPLAASPWDGATDFDAAFGSFAAADRIIYAGSNGHRRVTVATAAGPGSAWRTQVRGPSTGGARVATAAAPKHTAAVFSTFGAGDIGSVYLVRQSGVSAPGATQRISGKGHIRSVAVAVNAAGDTLAAWDRNGTIEARLYFGGSRRLGPVQTLGKVNVASRITVALGADRRATVAWIDQGVSNGESNQQARIMATARSASRGFATAATQLELYPDTAIPGGTGVRAAYTSDGRGIVAFSGRQAVRVAFVDGRSIGAAQILTPVLPDAGQATRGLGNLVVSPGGAAAVTAVTAVDATRNQVLAAALPANATAFGPAEAVSEIAVFLGSPSAAFDPATGRVDVAWSVPPQQDQPARVEMSQRPAP